MLPRHLVGKQIEIYWNEFNRVYTIFAANRKMIGKLLEEIAQLKIENDILRTNNATFLSELNEFREKERNRLTDQSNEAEKWFLKKLQDETKIDTVSN